MNINEISELGVLGILMYVLYIQRVSNADITKAINSLTIAINRLLELERLEDTPNMEEPHE